jgi:catechol 2,3-dioxygenase-like lactoylglutathione lyase family enzyme
MAGITHLRSITISAEDPSSLLPFYEQAWGLERVAETDAGTIMLRARGAEHHVFSLVPGPGHALEQIALGAESPDAVDAIAERLRAAGLMLEREPGPVSEPGGGYALVVHDPEGRRIEISAEVAVHDGPSSRDFGPDRLSHIVLNSVNVPASKQFFTEILGFRISDWYENDQMVFLSCNELHHCVVLAEGRWTSLNHVAFEVSSADEVMRALGRMRKAGVDTVWGPGRHGPGGNVFCYFVDPVGNVIEYTAELLILDGDWQPQAWKRSQENADVWGTSGGLSPAVIAAMSNPPAAEQTP